VDKMKNDSNGGNLRLSVCLSVL